MDLRSAATWSPPDGWVRYVAIDSHTGGEPFRVVVEGLDPIPGDTVLERRRYATENLDHLRRALMWEPRGHADMYGGWIGPPTSTDGDIAVLFTHNDGFSTMCGHGIIALAKVTLDTGILQATPPETTLRIDTPAGPVLAIARHGHDGLVESTTFENVPSFVVELDATVSVDDGRSIEYDLAFGGAFYAVVDAASAGVSFDDPTTLMETGRLLKRSIASSRSLEHPDHPDLGFLYGVIFTGPASGPGAHSRNVCVFADGEVDRSPTGTGVSSRLAILHARGEIGIGDQIVVESITGSRFTGSVITTTGVDGHPAVVPRIEGTAHIIGRSELWIDPTDPLGGGFLVR